MGIKALVAVASILCAFVPAGCEVTANKPSNGSSLGQLVVKIAEYLKSAIDNTEPSWTSNCPVAWRLFLAFVAAMSFFGKNAHFLTNFAKVFQSVPKFRRTFLVPLFPEWLNGHLPEWFANRPIEIQRYMLNEMERHYRPFPCVVWPSTAKSVRASEEETELMERLSSQVVLTEQQFQQLKVHVKAAAEGRGNEHGDTFAFEMLRDSTWDWKHFQSRTGDEHYGWFVRLLAFHTFLGVWFLTTVYSFWLKMSNTLLVVYIFISLKVVIYMLVCWGAAFLKPWFLAVDPFALCSRGDPYTLWLALTFLIAPEVFPIAELLRDISPIVGIFYSSFLMITDLLGYASIYLIHAYPLGDESWTLELMTLMVSLGAPFGFFLLYSPTGKEQDEIRRSEFCRSRIFGSYFATFILGALILVAGISIHDLLTINDHCGDLASQYSLSAAPAHSEFAGCSFAMDQYFAGCSFAVRHQEILCTCTFSCDEGYTQNADSAKVDCPLPNNASNNVSCPPINGDSSSVCLSVDCGQLSMDGWPTACSTSFGTTCFGDNLTFMCNSDGNWTPQAAYCNSEELDMKSRSGDLCGSHVSTNRWVGVLSPPGEACNVRLKCDPFGFATTTVEARCGPTGEWTWRDDWRDSCRSSILVVGIEQLLIFAWYLVVAFLWIAWCGLMLYCAPCCLGARARSPYELQQVLLEDSDFAPQDT